MSNSDPTDRSSPRTARFEDMRPLGRKVRGPLADLFDLQHPTGHHIAVAFASPGPIHEALSKALAPVRDFLEWPLVDGLAPLAGVRPGILVYRTGRPSRTVTELVSVFAEDGGLGPRATLQWLAQTSRTLIDASIAGHDRGLPSHGSLDPWFAMVDEVGQPVILGYGIPPFAVEAYLRGGREMPPVDRLRYAPPERLDGAAETVESDLYALCLMAVELASGQPVFRGSAAAVWAAAQRVDVRTSLREIPDALTAVVSPMLRAEDRLPDPERWWAQVDRASRQAPGMSLREAMEFAAEFATEAEEELPQDFRLADLLPDDPERRAAEARARRAQDAASEVIELLSAALDDPDGALDRSLPRIESILGAADVAIGAVEEAKRRVDQAVLRAGSAPDGASANVEADTADRALAEVQHHATEAHEKIGFARDQIASARLERLQGRAETVRRDFARAEALAAEAAWLPRLAERAHATLDGARAAFEGTRVDPEAPLSDDDQLGAIAELQARIDALETLADHARAVRQADGHARAVEELQRSHPDYSEELARHARAAREAADRARASETRDEADRALEEARQEATAAQAVGSFLRAIKVDANEAISQIIGAHAQVTEAYEAMPHASIAELQITVGGAVSTVQEDPSQAARQLVIATEAAEQAIELRQKLIRRLVRARQQAADQVEQALAVTAAVDDPSLSEPVDAIRRLADDAAEAQLPEAAEVAAAAAAEHAKELLSRVGGIQAEQQELRNRARQALVRLPDGVDPERLARLEAEIGGLADVRETSALETRVQEVRAAIDAWLAEIAQAQARLQACKEKGRKALGRAETDHLAAPDVVVQREGDDEPVDLAAMMESLQAVVAELEPCADAEEAADLAERAEAIADQIGAIVRAANDALVEEVQTAQRAAANLAADIVSQQSDAHPVELQAMYTRALELANRAAQSDELASVRRELTAAERAWTRAVEMRDAEVAHLESLQARARTAVEAADALLTGASQPGVRHHVEAVHTAVEQVHLTTDRELAAQAIDAAEMSLQAARQVANEATSAARARARAAVEHARRVLERHDEGEVRLYAEAARVAGEAAATATTCNAAVQAAERAELAAKAVEIARAQAAVERAAVALARSDGPEVRLAIEEARRGVSDAENADSIVGAARAADAATMAAEAAHKAAGRLAEVHDQIRARAQEALSAVHRAATETQVAVVRQLAQQGDAAMAQLEEADSLDLAEVALQEIEAAAMRAQQHATQFTSGREAEMVRATAAAARIERAREAARDSEPVAQIARAATERLEVARNTREANELRLVVDAIEHLAEEADEALAEHLGAVADTAQRAIASLARAEVLLDQTPDDEVRQLVQRAQEAARRAEELETLPAMQQAAALAEQALEAVQARVRAEATTARAGLEEQARSILVRMETAGAGFDDPRFVEHVDAIRAALDRIARAVDADSARAEVDAAAAAGEAAQAVVDSRLEVLRYQAREAATRAQQSLSVGAPSRVVELVERSTAASEETQRAINVAAAVAGAAQAEEASSAAIELASEHRQLLSEVQERAANARNRAEELIGRAPPAGMEAVEAARVAAEEALTTTELDTAMAAAQRAETAANRALTITDASRSVVETHRARVAAAAKRVEQASFEANESVVRDSITIVRNLSETVRVSADPAVTEPAARAAEEAAERAEAAIADRRARVAAIRQRADDTRARAESLLGLSGAPAVAEAVEVAKAAAERAARAEDLSSAKEALVDAEEAIAEAQRIAHAEVEQRTAARRRAQRALGAIQTLLDEIETDALQQARAGAREAVAQAGAATTVEVAAEAADRAEGLLVEAETAAEAYRARLEAARQRAREANEAARAVLHRARGSVVEKAVDAARRAFDAATTAAAVEPAEAAAARAEEAAQLASNLADQAARACREARERAHAAVEQARQCVAELPTEHVQRKVDEAVAAAERADRAIAPEVASQAAEAAELAASGAREEIEIRRVQQEAGKDKEQVAALLVPDLPQDAPPELVQQHQALRQALVGVDQAVSAVQGARGLAESRARAEVAKRAAADVLSRFEALAEAIRVWQAQQRRRAATDVRPVEDLLQKVRAATKEARRIAPAAAYGVHTEADNADAAAAEAVEVASRAAEAGDPDGVTQGLDGLRKALSRANQAIKTAQMALQIEAQRRAAKVRQALRTALDQAEAMRQDAQVLVERVVDGDAQWHASRAAEAAAAARDAAQAVMSEEPSDEGIERVERSLVRAQGALAAAFEHAPPGAQQGQRSVRPGERNPALEQLQTLRSPRPEPTPSFKADPVPDEPVSRPIGDVRRPVPDAPADPGPLRASPSSSAPAPSAPAPSAPAPSAPAPSAPAPSAPSPDDELPPDPSPDAPSEPGDDETTAEEPMPEPTEEPAVPRSSPLEAGPALEPLAEASSEPESVDDEPTAPPAPPRAAPPRAAAPESSAGRPAPPPLPAALRSGSMVPSAPPGPPALDKLESLPLSDEPFDVESVEDDDSDDVVLADSILDVVDTQPMSREQARRRFLAGDDDEGGGG